MQKRTLLRDDSGQRLFLVDPWLKAVSEDYAGILWPVALIAADHIVDAGVIRPALIQLLRAGCTYLCFHAPNATELHRLADDLDVELTRNGDTPLGRGEVAMTVGEDGQSIDEAISFFALCALPPFRRKFDRIALPLGLGRFKESLADRLRISTDF